MWLWPKDDKIIRHGQLLDRPLDDPPVCRECGGACCRAFPSVALSWDEYHALKDLGARRLEFTLVGPPLLMIENGCEFLADGQCTIYSQRPEICRRFVCSD